jgi:hypothetical protein
MSRTIIVLAILPQMAIACASTASAVRPTPGGVLGTLGSSNCTRTAHFHIWAGAIPEAGVDSPRGSFWALFFNPVPPSAGKEIKVVWRMTGSGLFKFRVSDTAGMLAPLAWGPESHLSSNWNHPGDEVGTGFNFPHPGCWDIHVARSDTSGDLWLAVAA